MDKLKVTVIGQDLFKIAEEKFELAGLNMTYQVNNGMLGNLKTLTYEFLLDEDEVIEKRKKVMNLMAEDSMRMLPMYCHGDWMRIFVIKPLKM